MTESRQREPQSSNREPLGFDEFVAVLVALLAIGSIFFWVLSRRPIGWNVTTTAPAQVDPSPRSSLLIPWLATRGVDRQRRPVRQGIDPTTGNIVAPDPRRNVAGVGVAPGVAPVPGILGIVPVPPARVERPAATRPVIPLQPKAVPDDPVPPAPTARTAQPIQIVDVPGEYWAAPYIFGLQRQGVISAFPGGYFRPEQPITRAEFAAIIEKGLGTRITDETIEFPDVSNSFWAAPAIKKATGSNFIAGFPDKTFRPNLQMPRAQAIVALASGLNLPEPDNVEEILKQKYQDAAEIPNYARRKIAAATMAGIVVNHPNTDVLNPNENATRADIAALVYRARVNQGKAQSVNGKNVVQP